MQALASEMADQVPGSEIVATRLAEILFIQVLRSYIASEPERNQGWLRAIFDPQIGTALTAFHEGVNVPWTVESLADAAGMSRSAFAVRFKELLGQNWPTAFPRLDGRNSSNLRDFGKQFGR